MAGPVYHGIDPKNKYAPTDKRVAGPLVMNGPVYKGMENHKFNTMPDKAEITAEVHHPVLPTNYQHKYNPFDPKKEVTDVGMRGPVYDVLDDHHFREVISAAISLSPNNTFNSDMSTNLYYPEVSETEKVTSLLGPVYDILSEHHFNQINAVSNELKSLQNPVYLPEASHHYREIEKHVDTLEKLTGPIYDIKRDHCFKEIFKSIDKVKKLQGPIYDLGLPTHHFSQIEQHLDNIKELKGPIYDVESKNTFSQIIKHVEELKALQVKDSLAVVWN